MAQGDDEVSLRPVSVRSSLVLDTVEDRFNKPMITAGLQWDADPRTTRGRVVAIHHAGRDRGFCSFPCFEMSARTEPGMSGGPLFDEDGRLCGLVFGGGLSRQDGTAIRYGTLLWPLLLLEGIKGKWEGETERLFSFHELVKRRGIAATGLDARVEIWEFEGGRLAVGPRRPVA